MKKSKTRTKTTSSTAAVIGIVAAACVSSSSSSSSSSQCAAVVPMSLPSPPPSSSSSSSSSSSRWLHVRSLARRLRGDGIVPRGGHTHPISDDDDDDDDDESVIVEKRHPGHHNNKQQQQQEEEEEVDGREKHGRTKKKKTTTKKKKKMASRPKTTQGDDVDGPSCDAGSNHDDGSSTSGNDDGNVNENESSSSSSSSSRLPTAIETILEQTCHYDVLGITRSASRIEIKKAYRRRCVLTHPDKTPGGDRTAFDRVSEAYDVLGSEEKRALYDRYGRDGVEKAGDGGGRGGDGFGGYGGGGMDVRFGAGGASFFGNDVFRDFFGGGGVGVDPFLGRRGASSTARQWASSPPLSKPRNRDLRYQLEVTLEELYAGSTKRVAIRQPDPMRPNYPRRKEVDVCLTRGMRDGQSVRLCGVVDSISDAPPAVVIFLLRERRHPTFARRGDDLAMEVRIGLGEAIAGYRREMRCLDGRTIVIGSPFVRRAVVREEAVDAKLDASPAFPSREEGEKENEEVVDGGGDDATMADASMKTPVRITKSTTASYDLPPSMIRTGDVHVLKGYGMPRGGGGHDRYGDLYVQYVVEMPGGGATSVSSSSSTTMTATTTKKANADDLLPDERVELARLLNKLEGTSYDPASHVVRVVDAIEGVTEAMDDAARVGRDSEDPKMVHHLESASASDFGRPAGIPSHDDDERQDHDEHLRPDDDSNMGASRGGDFSDFFHRAFAAGRGSPSLSSGGFRYFSSSSGGSFGGTFGGDLGAGGFGYGGGGDVGGLGEEDHKVECNQM